MRISLFLNIEVCFVAFPREQSALKYLDLWKRKGARFPRWSVHVKEHARELRNFLPPGTLKSSEASGCGFRI